MSGQQLVIRHMNRDELELAIEWAAKEGWNPGLHDLSSFYATDPEGFLAGFIDEEPVAIISAVNYDDNFGFIGFYIVKPEYRGHGYGMQIWMAAMRRLDGLNIGLDGVVDQQANYKKSGFKLAYRNMRFEGISDGPMYEHSQCIELSKIPIQELLDYDRSFFPAVRSQFIQHWIVQPEAKSLGILDGDKLVGYGVIRRCRLGYKVGPLFADNKAFAETLFCVLKSNVPADQPVYLDVPEINEEAIALAKSHNMNVMFETARMYTGHVPDISVSKTFGVTTFELG